MRYKRKPFIDCPDWQKFERRMDEAIIAWYALGEAEQDATQWQLCKILGAISHMTLIAMTGGADAPKAKAKDRKATQGRTRSRKGPNPQKRIQAKRTAKPHA